MWLLTSWQLKSQNMAWLTWTFVNGSFMLNHTYRSCHPDDIKPYSVHTGHGFMVKESRVLSWPVCSPNLSPMVHYQRKTMTTEVSSCLIQHRSAGTFWQPTDVVTTLIISLQCHLAVGGRICTFCPWSLWWRQKKTKQKKREAYRLEGLWHECHPCGMFPVRTDQKRSDEGKLVIPQLGHVPPCSPMQMGSDRWPVMYESEEELM